MYTVFFEKNTVGCYGKDADGNVWSTFSCIGMTLTCDECGTIIDGGYAKGKRGEGTYYCAKHVRYVPNKRGERTFPKKA